jgi:ferredoxin
MHAPKCFIRGAVREDSTDSENREEQSLLKIEVRASLEDEIQSAASGCPVEVIKFM